MRFPNGLLLLSLALAACSPTSPADNPFAPVAVTPANPPMAPGDTPSKDAKPEDDAFAEPEPVKLSSEQMAQGTVAVATAAGVDVDALAGAPAAAPASAPAPTPVGLPPQTRWPVRLVSTLPQAQPPRAILGLPSGQEVVVSPGSMLADQGIVVVAVTATGVELAQIEPAGDHAAITPITLTPQYP